jgi:hypothetical protein
LNLPSHTSAKLLAAADLNTTAAVQQARTVIAECDHKLRRYRAALEAGADPTIVASWIAAATAERDHAQADLDRHGNRRPAPHRLTRDQIAALIATWLALGWAVLRRKERVPSMQVLRGTRVEVTSDRVQPWQLDGDLIEPGRLLKVRVLPKALWLCVPQPAGHPDLAQDADAAAERGHRLRAASASGAHRPVRSHTPPPSCACRLRTREAPLAVRVEPYGIGFERCAPWCRCRGPS